MLTQLLLILAVLTGSTAYLIKVVSPSNYFYWKRLAQIYVIFGVITVVRTVANLLKGKFKVDSYSSSTVSKEWLRSILQQHYKSVPAIVDMQVEGGTLRGGLTSELQKIIITWPKDAPEELPRTIVMKTARPTFSSFVSCATLGTAREALFYKNFVLDHDLKCAPRIFYSEGSMLTGEYMILMEDLSAKATPGGHLFGNQCWGSVTLPSHVEQNPVRVLEVLYQNTADLHARFWRQKSLLQIPWLKCTDYLQGKNQDRWEFGFDRLVRRWRRVMAKQSSVKWSETLKKEIEAALSNSSWSKLQARFDVNKEDTPFTLCHGDFHASNALWLGETSPTPIILVDWSEVGVFCPFTDLAQFVVSHVSIDMRRKHEYDLFKQYHKRLIEQGVCEKTFPLDACWERYKSGGTERWLNLLVYLASMPGLPESAVQWFHDQVSSFVEDHSSSGNTLVYTSYLIP